MKNKNNMESDILQDFANILSILPNSVIEISHAPAGTSEFSHASYYHKINIREINSLLEKFFNIGFLCGISEDYFKKSAQDISYAQVTNRIATDEMVVKRNILSLNIDFKEIIPEFKSLSPNEKYEIAKEKFISLHEKLKTKICDVWLSVFSGNGFHLHFKLKSPIDCSDYKKYSHHYLELVRTLEEILQINKVKLFDRQCQNTSRLMRLPLSTNWKDYRFPIKTQILYHNSNADASKAIALIWERANDLWESFQIKNG